MEYLYAWRFIGRVYTCGSQFVELESSVLLWPLWDISSPHVIGFILVFFAWVGYIISAAHDAGPEVFTLAVEKAREEETEEEDGQLPELHGQDAPGRRRRGLRQHGAHDEELHAQDRELPHLRTMEP